MRTPARLVLIGYFVLVQGGLFAADGKPSTRPGTKIVDGEIMWLDLPVKRAGEPDWFLTWAVNRSQVFEFERLAQPPRLHRKGQPNCEGESIPAITLEVVPEGGVPKVPDLLPSVPFKS